MVAVHTSGGSSRLSWLDNAKAIGIVLVFYGHLLEVLYLHRHTAMFSQFRFIYAFHMPLFFILAGFVASRRQESFSGYVTHRLKTRLIPFLFFNFLGLLCLMLVDLGHGGLRPLVYVRGLLALLGGRPSFNFLTWFLVCLFMVELFHFGGRRYFQTIRQQAAAALVFIMVGWGITWWVSFQGTILLPTNFWYLHEATIAYGFYLLGVAGRQATWTAGHGRRPLLFFAFLLCACVAVLTYGRNDGPFITDIPVVLMADSSHGHWFWFPITAVAGTLLVIFLSQLLPNLRPLHYLGQNSLILMGLNGLFFEFFNQPIIAAPFWANSYWAVTAQAILITAFSIATCLPAIHFSNKYIPHLIGKPPS
jgi:acyltransferase